jgi:hypothetical protein
MENAEQNITKKRNPLDSVRSKDHIQVTEISSAKPKFLRKLLGELK